MTTALLTPDMDKIVCEIDIAAPPERVFKAITDPEEVRRRSPLLDVFEMDTRVGGRWCLEMRPAQPYRGFTIIRHDGEILELDPPRLLVYTWLANFHTNPKRPSIVRWELEPTKSGTHVRLTHSGLKAEPAAAKEYSGGWPSVLAELKSFLEQPAAEEKERSMPAALITPDLDAVVCEIDIAAPPQRIFQALTDQAQLARWFSDTTIPLKFWKFDPRLGGKYRYATEKGSVTVNGVSEFDCQGDILEFDPPRLLVYTWLANWHNQPQHPTIVRWELSPTPLGTHVKVTHSGLAQEEVARKDYQGGWPGVLANLKTFAER